MKQRPLRQGWRRLFLAVVVVFVPPLLFLAVWLYANRDEAAPVVEIRQGGDTLARGSIEESLAALEERTGLEVSLPKGALAEAYELAYVDSALPGDFDRQETAALLFFERESDDDRTLSITVLRVNQLQVQPEVPELEAGSSVPGSKIYWVGGRSTNLVNRDRLQLFARSPAFDYLVVLVGLPLPEEDDAVELVESVLRQE